jgi:hypothetical protein
MKLTWAWMVRGAIASLLLPLTVLFVQSSSASMACPVSLLDGEIDQAGIDLSFRNKGKLPIQESEFYCSSTGGRPGRRAMCHEESGLFFPGNVYELSFAQAAFKQRALLTISVRSARLSDGSVWMANRDQPCHVINVRQKRS